MMKRSTDVDNDSKSGVAQAADGSGTEGLAAGGAEAVSDNPAEGGPDAAAMRTRIAEQEREIAELKDKYLRTLADSDNARKRIRQQSEESVRIQRESFLRDLLPIVDNLERAVEAARGGGDGQPIVEGVELVLRSLIDYLRAHGVTPVVAVGQPFDPQLHEAADHVHSTDYPPNTVISEFHRGYAIGDRTLRPARVAVAKGHASGNGGNGNTGGPVVENS